MDLKRVLLRERSQTQRLSAAECLSHDVLEKARLRGQETSLITRCWGRGGGGELPRGTEALLGVTGMLSMGTAAVVMGLPTSAMTC